jgi:hypothetical protein
MTRRRFSLVFVPAQPMDGHPSPTGKGKRPAMSCCKSFFDVTSVRSSAERRKYRRRRHPLWFSAVIPNAAVNGLSEQAELVELQWIKIDGARRQI